MYNSRYIPCVPSKREKKDYKFIGVVSEANIKAQKYYTQIPQNLGCSKMHALWHDLQFFKNILKYHKTKKACIFYMDAYQCLTLMSCDLFYSDTRKHYLIIMQEMQLLQDNQVNQKQTQYDGKETH